MEPTKENPKMEKVILEKIGDHVTIEGPYTKRGLRALLLSSISLPTLSAHEAEETLNEIGLSHVDLEKLKRGKTDEISDEAKEKLTHLEITDEMIAEHLSKSLHHVGDKISEKPAGVFPGPEGRGKVDAKKTQTDEEKFRMDPREEIEKFLRERGLSESLIKTLLAVGLTDEFIRLLKAMGLTDEDIAELQKLWQLELMEQKEEDSFASSISSSDEYLSSDGLYLKNFLSKPVTDALREIVAKKPFDPIEYLAHWLLNYKVCEERIRKQKEFDLELMIERERLKVPDAEDEAPVFFDQGGEEESMRDTNYLDYEGF